MTLHQLSSSGVSRRSFFFEKSSPNFAACYSDLLPIWDVIDTIYRHPSCTIRRPRYSDSRSTPEPLTQVPVNDPNSEAGVLKLAMIVVIRPLQRNAHMTTALAK